MSRGVSAAPGAVKAVAPPPKGDAAPAKGQGGGGAPPKAGSGNSTPKPTSSGSLRAVAPPNRSATAVQPGARPSTPPPVKPMPAGGSKNAQPAAKPLTPEQQRAQDLTKAARAKALMPVINLHSSHTVADEQAWGDLAQTKNLLQRGGDLFVGDGFARYDEARSKLQAVYDRGVNGQISVADAKQQMAQLMGQYRQGHQAQMQGYRDRANIGNYTVVPLLRGLEMGSNASTAILVTMKTGSWQAGWAASMAKRTTQDFATDWLYNKSPIAHFYDRGVSQYVVAPTSEKRVVENFVGSLGDAIFGGSLSKVTAAVTTKLTTAIGTKALGVTITEKLIPRIAGALAFPAGNLARTPTDLAGTWSQQQFAARDVEQQITQLNDGYEPGREQVRTEQAKAVEAQRGAYLQQYRAAVLREAPAQLRQQYQRQTPAAQRDEALRQMQAQVPGLVDQEMARIAQELRDPSSKLVQQGRTQFEQKKSQLVEQAASAYDKNHIAAVQAAHQQIEAVHANTPKLLQEQLWGTVQSLPVAALTGWAFGAAPDSVRPMTAAEAGSRNLLTRPIAAAGQPLYTISGQALLGETLISGVSSAANEVVASRFNGKPLTAENLISQTLSGAVNLPMVNEARVLGANKLLADAHIRPEAVQSAVPEDPTENRGSPEKDPLSTATASATTLPNETKLADGVFQRGNRVVLRSPELEVSLPPGWQFGPLASLENLSGPGSGYISLTGHGALMPTYLREHGLPRLTKVPEGTRVVLLAPPGAILGTKLGEAINRREFVAYDFQAQKMLPIKAPFRVLEAGQSLPNYVIGEPEGLNVPARADVIAPRRGADLLLSRALKPNMGTVVINTCGFVKGAPTTQWSHLAFEPHRVLDRDRRLLGLPDQQISYGPLSDAATAAGASDALTSDRRAPVHQDDAQQAPSKLEMGGDREQAPSESWREHMAHSPLIHFPSALFDGLRETIRGGDSPGAESMSALREGLHGVALQLFEAPNSSDQAAPHPDTLRRVSLFKTISQPTIGANGEPQARKALVLDPRGNPVPNGMGKEFLLTLPNAQGIETQVLGSDLDHPDVKSKLAQRGLLDPIVLRDGRVTNISSAKVEELHAKVQAFDGYLFIEMPPSPKGVLKPYYSFGELWALSQMTGREVAPMMNPGTGLPDDTTPGEPPTGFDLDPKQVREHLINEFDENTKRWYVSLGPTPRRVNGELVMNVTAPKGFYVPFHTHPNQTRAYPSGGDVRNARQALLANLSSMILPASPKVSPATIAPVFYGNDPVNRGHDVGRRPVLRSSIDANLNDVLTRERSLGPRPEVGAASTARKFVLPPERTARQLIEQGFEARFVGGKLGGIVRELQRAGHGARGIVELSARSDDRYYFNIVNVDGQVRFIHPDRHRATPISVREALDPAFALRVAPQQIVAALGGRSPDGLRWSLLRTERRPFEAPRWSWPPQEFGPGKGNLWRSLFRMPTAVPDAALGGSTDPLWPPNSTDLPAALLHREGVLQSLTPEQQEVARKHETQWAKARDAHGLASIDFAGEFTDTYQEVRTAVDHVLRAAPGDDTHGDERKSVGAFAPARKAPSVADWTPFAPPLAKPSLPDAAIRVHAGVSALAPEARRALEGEPSRWAPATPQQQSSPPDGDAPKGLRAAWARAVTKSVKTIEQARNAYLRELAAYYRSGVNPALANRRAFLDGLLHGKTHAVEFIEIPGVLKPINDHVGHVAADKLLAQVLDTAADVARQHTRVTVYQLDALRLAVEGSKSDVSAFADAFEARMQKLELGYVAHGIRYANKAQDDAADPSVREGLPVVRAQLGASAAGSRKELLAQGVEALDRASERLKRPEAEGGELDPERGAHLLKLKQTTAAANDEPLSAKDPGLDPELQPKDDERRATQQLSAAMLAALHEQTERVIGADPAQLPACKRAIEDLVTKAFSTDEAFGRHLGNQLAFDRAVGERAFRFVRSLHGFIDVGAVGVTNRLVSRFGGDAVLTVVHATADRVAQRINQRMGLAGGKALEVFAVGGDEIRFISSELHVLRRFEKAFALAMRHATIDGTAGNTPAVRQPVQLSEIPVYIGVGKTKEEAEARSNAAKAGDPQRAPGRLPPSYVVGLTGQDMPWAKPPTPLPADIASADPAQLYRTHSSALSRLFAHGSSHPGATWHLVNSKDLPLARVTFSESGVAAYQRLERGGWTAAANLDHDHFVRLPERLGELFVSVDPVPPAWSPRLQKIDPAALPRGNASGLIDSATAFDRVLENAWLHRNMVANPRFRWELLTPNGQPSRSFDLARLQQQIELLAERSPGSEQQHGMGWQEFRNPGHQGGVTTFQIYASVQPDSAALVAREILDAAPAIGGLEGFKVARDEVKSALPANLMLYVSSQRGLHDVVSALRQIQSRHPEAFLPSSQTFAQEQLLPGVGYAQALDLPHHVIARRSSLETPTAMRFALVKRALQEVMQEGGNEADFRARAEQLLIEHNIDPQAPHLNLYNRGPRAIDMATFDPDALAKMPNLDAAARLPEEFDAAAEALRANGHVAEASRLAAQAIVVRQALRNEQATRALRAGDVRNMLSPRDDSAENNTPQASDQSLRGADLSGRNLGSMNLSGADLRYANLHRSNLFGMVLHGANLTGANLVDAGLSRADLGNANLTAANIGGAMLHLARLENATLNNANLGGVQMKRAVLRGASADGADWSNADLHKSDFSNARLRSARLSDAQLGSVNFEGADLTGADIRGSEFYLPTMNLQSAKLEGLQTDPRVLANLRRGAPPLEGVTLLKFHSDHTAKLVTRSASALPTLEQGGYLVVAAVPKGKGMQDGTVLMAPTSNALWNGDQRPPGAERKPQASHRVLAQNGVFQALSKDSVVLGATLMPEPPTDTVMGSAPRYRLSTQSWSVNSLINGYLGTRRIDPVVIDSSKPDIRPNDVYLPAEVSQPLAERLERDLGILITHLDGHPRHTALTHVAPPNDKQALQPLIDAGLLKNGTITADGVSRLAQARRELATEVGVDARAIEIKVAALKIGQDHWHALIGRNAQAVDREHSYRSQLVQAMAPLNLDNARKQIGATSDSARQTQ
jgi:uncharacterized protein YjbI with pentapeptide repeats/GGDEF domain-containing protein